MHRSKIPIKFIHVIFTGSLLAFTQGVSANAQPHIIGSDGSFVTINIKTNGILQTSNFKTALLENTTLQASVPYLKPYDFIGRSVLKVLLDDAGHNRIFLGLIQSQEPEPDGILILRRTDLSFIHAIDFATRSGAGTDVAILPNGQIHLFGAAKTYVFDATTYMDLSNYPSSTMGPISCLLPKENRLLSARGVYDLDAKKIVVGRKELLWKKMGVRPLDCKAGKVLLAPHTKGGLPELLLYDLKTRRVDVTLKLGGLLGGVDPSKEWQLSGDGRFAIYSEIKEYSKGFAPALTGKLLIFDLITGKKLGEVTLPSKTVVQMQNYESYEFQGFSSDNRFAFYYAQPVLHVVDIQRQAITGEITLPFRPVGIIW